MPSIRINMELTTGIYCLTFTIKNWYYIFDRHNRFDILYNSIKYCQKYKGLKTYAYVFMINHIHLIAKSPDMIGFVRDYKKYTSKEIQNNIIATEPTVLSLFHAGMGKYEFWAKTNMPKMIETEEYLLQKIKYIENNPVRRRYVARAENWVWSSANRDNDIELERLVL